MVKCSYPRSMRLMPRTEDVPFVLQKVGDALNDIAREQQAVLDSSGKKGGGGL